MKIRIDSENGISLIDLPRHNTFVMDSEGGEHNLEEKYDDALLMERAKAILWDNSWTPGSMLWRVELDNGKPLSEWQRYP